MKEKSWEEIEKEYASIKKERREATLESGSGRWEKCPRCHGTGVSTCSMCKGLGHIVSSQIGVYTASGKTECPLCHGAKQMKCHEYGCNNGWIWVPNITRQ